jgi:hypothetical protein
VVGAGLSQGLEQRVVEGRVQGRGMGERAAVHAHTGRPEFLGDPLEFPVHVLAGQ